MSILKFSQDRTADFNEESKKIYKVIEDFGDDENLKPLLTHFEKKYSLPKEVTKKRIKKLIALRYKYKSAKFDRSLLLRNLFYQFFKVIYIFIRLIFYTNKSTGIKHYKIIVDDVRDDLQLMRFEKLINYFGKDKTLIIIDKTVNIENFSDYNLKIMDPKRCDGKVVFKLIFSELFVGLWVCLKASIAMGLNLFVVYPSIVLEYCRYKTLFNSYQSDYLIQERHYNTNPIKNYLFKNSGGIATTSIQKNLIENDHLFYYIDIDYMFTLGQITIDITFEYGARIDKIIPVGSLFMEYNWFNNSIPIKKNIDVIMLGINTSNAYERLDKYNGFINDYYDSIRWLIRFKNEYPSYRVAIKHHSSANKDDIEDDLVSNSEVEVISKDNSSGNSYHLAFNSRCIVTYGSTMGYEMIAHGVPSFFLDPGNQNSFLYDLRNEKYGHLLLDNYDAFRDTLISVLNEPKKQHYNEKILSKSLCHESSNVSHNIYEAFQ